MDDSTRQAARLWTVAMPSVSAFVASVVRDFRERDDVLQEIAVAVMESFNGYDADRPLIPWVMGVARNQVGLYLRRRRRDRHVFDDQLVAELADVFAEATAEESPKLGFLGECLNQLDGRARQLCELRYRQDLKPAAIAALLGISANSVAKALHRIRDALRDCIERKAAADSRC